MEILTKQITRKIRKSKKSKNRLAYDFNVTNNTINNWLDNNDKGQVTLLTTPLGLNAISEELSVDKSQLLTSVA